MDSPLSAEEATLDVDANNLVACTTTTDTQLLYEWGDLDTVVAYDLAGEAVEGVCYAGMASRTRYPERSFTGGIKAGFACADRIDVKRSARLLIWTSRTGPDIGRPSVIQGKYE